MRVRNSIVSLTLTLMLIFPSLCKSEEIVLFETKVQEPTDAIFLPVTINSKSYAFLFDSGSTLTVLDNSLETLLGEPLDIKRNANTPSDQLQLSYYKPIDAMIGKLNLNTRLPFITADLKFAGKALGREFHGIVSMSFIHNYIWKFDFNEGTLKILSSASTINHDGYDEIINMRPTVRGVPTIMIDLLGNSMPFIVDSGDTGNGSITGDVIDQMIKNNFVSDVASDSSVAASGSYSARRLRVKHFKIGGIEYNGLLMRESKQNTIGLRLLKYHNFILDFPNSLLYLQKRPFVSIVDREDKSGIKIINDNGQIVIGFIDKRGPGAAAGLKEGDLIKSIDNRLVDGKDLLIVRNIFKGEDGKKILIRLERDGKKIETGIVLKKGFDHLIQAN